MIGFAQIAGGSPGSAGNMVDHLLTQTMEGEEARLASYYNRGGEKATEGEEANIAALRRDIHPRVAEGLGVMPGQRLSRDQINALLVGNRADGGRIEAKRYFTERNRGIDEKTGEKLVSTPIGSYDFCPTPHKSVSVAWAFAAPAERAIIFNCVQEAARDAVGEIAREIGVARLGDGGTGGAEKGHVGWIEFVHHTARRTTATVENGEVSFSKDRSLPGDPDLHVHFLIPNAVFCDSGRVGSLHTERVHGFIFEADALFHARLADRLSAAGYDVTQDEKTGAARLVAVPDEVCRQFSKRTLTGEEAARAQALTRGESWDALTQEQRAARMKSSVQDRNQRAAAGKDDVANFADWRRQAAAMGWQAPEVFRERHKIAELSQEDRIRLGYETALGILEKKFEQRAVLSHHEVRAAAGLGLVAAGGAKGTADIDAVTALMRAEGARQYGEKTPLVWGTEEGRKHLSITTGLHEAHEREFIDLAKKAAADRSAALPKRLLDRTVRESGLDFTTDHGKAQLRAIDALGRGGRLGVMVGAAGAGKSALLRPLVSAWQEQGRTVYGSSLAWRQADDLADAGIAKQNVKAFSVFIDAAKAGELKLDRNSVVAVDELGLLGTRQGLELLRLRERHGFSVVALGDGKQCSAVQAGAVIDLARRALGVEQVPQILTTVRQQSEREKRIVGLFRDGRAREALDMKRADGTAEMVPGAYDAVVARAAKLYTERFRETGEAPSVAAPTNMDAHRIGAAIREERRAMGLLGQDLRSVKVRQADGEVTSLAIAKGEHLRLFASTKATLANGRRAPIGRNGTVIEVQDIDRDGITAKSLKTGRVGRVKWPDLADKAGEIRLAYGYAQTIHTAQGSTSREHILTAPAGSQAIDGLDAYSGGTRHRIRSYFLTSEHAEQEGVRSRRPLNDPRPIDTDDLWGNVGRHMAYQPEKETAVGMFERAAHIRRGAVRDFAQSLQPAEARALRGEPPAHIHEVGFHRRLARAVERSAERVAEIAKHTVEHVRHAAHARHRQRHGMGH